MAASRSQTVSVQVMATLLSALEAHGGKKGVASLCIGGGEATAVVVAVELIA